VIQIYLSTPRIAFILIDLQSNALKTNGFIFGTKVYVPTMHTLHTHGPPPKILPRNGQHQCFWCIEAKLLWRRLSAAAYGCALLLLVTFALDELAVS